MVVTRAISTVLDASVCVLLVSASALALASAPVDQRSDPDTADRTAELLATSTAQVEYEVGDSASSDRVASRTVHDTLTGLLATVAVTSARVGDSRIADAGAFERAVADRVNRTLRRSETSAQVRADWEPHSDSTLGGEVVAGETPPPDADVHAATLSVSSDLPTVRSEAVSAARRDGFAGVARVVAQGVVRGLFPPGETRTALAARSARADRAATRYRETARAFGGAPGVRRALRAENATKANRALADGLAPAVESDLRAEFRTPTDAARELSVGRVRVTVRTWSA
ncbi:DUF7284 family protein [Halorussus amylolyticus]|uniref:DUF7284 family protein n=1 Tax=Halorussus amylolyticus TaxID=1126242 RepID=UPI00138F212F|nr:hypothetical protein [Halorussus amylolyticus]